MQSLWARIGAIGIAASIAAASSSCAPQSATQISRGEYLVGIIGCSDCHTPGGLTPHPDLGRYLAGSDTEFDMPGQGAFTPPNLTPDAKTGLGTWTSGQIVAAITTGVTPEGRILSPAMPWSDFSHLTKSDALAIAAYLKSIPPIRNKIPGPAAPKPAAADAVESIIKRSP